MFFEVAAATSALCFSVESPALISNVVILIPAYGGADRLRVCLRSLAAYAPACCQIFVLDDGTPDTSIRDCCREFERENLVYVRDPVNKGFVEVCNWGWTNLAPQGSDVLLLNSDTQVTAGFLEEMYRVLTLSERHGVVSPRSNRATIFSIPPESNDLEPEECYEIWREIRFDLPEYQVMPTAVGFCMLVGAKILELFGLFDTIYSPGYNEENDLVCRINRCGFSAVAANRAFVFHYESSTFGSKRKALEKRNRRILLRRYPEYKKKHGRYSEYELNPLEKLVLRRRHRAAVLFDLHHLPPKRSGSSEIALNVLRELDPLLEEEGWDLFIGVNKEAGFFANELNGYRVFRDRARLERTFDLAFKPCQIFTWAEFRRMHRVAPRLSFVLLDIISVRCDYLTGTDRKTIFHKTLELADQVFTISDFSRSDYQSYFNVDYPLRVVHLGTNAGLSSAETGRGDYVLIVGNSYAHKRVKDALAHLKDVGPIWVLGGDKPSEQLPSHIHWCTSGAVTPGFMRPLYAKASVLVYPSVYEGFGLPIVEALALGKHVIALDNQTNRELAASLNDTNLILIPSLRDLKQVVERVLQLSMKKPITLPSKVRRWREVAEEYMSVFREMLRRPPDAQKLRARHDLIRVLNSARHG